MGKWYYLNAALEKVGPVAPQVLKTLAENGIIVPSTTLISEDGNKTYEAGRVKGLFTAAEPTAPGTHHYAVPVSPPPVLPLPPSSPSPASPWDSFPAQFANPPSSPQISFPNNWSSSFEFPTTAQSTGPTIPYQPQSRRSQSGFPAGKVIGFVVALICLLALVKIGMVVVRLAQAVPETAVSADNNETADLFSEDLAVTSPIALRPPDPEHTASRADQKSTTPNPVGLPPRRNSVSPAQSSIPPEKKGATWFDPPESRKKSPPPNKGQETSGRKSLPVVAIKKEPLPPPHTGSKSVEEIVAEVEGAVALVTGKNSSGSGFVLLPGIVVTNSHVINAEEIDELEIIFPSESGTKKGPFTAILLYEDPDRDLALLKIPTREHYVIPMVHDYKFRRGQKVIAIGNPGGIGGKILENAVCEGILSTQTEVDDLPYFQLSIAINHGNSGGPILDDAGNALGVATLKMTKNEAIAYCIPPDALAHAIEILWQSDSETIQQVNTRHRPLVGFNRGVDKLVTIIQVPAAVLDDPPEIIRDLAHSAVQDFDEAERNLPKDDRVFFYRALVKLVVNDFTGALTDLNVAARLAPDKPEIVGLRDNIRQAMAQRNQAADGRSSPTMPLSTFAMPDMNRFRPPVPMIPPPRMPDSMLRPPGPSGMRPPVPGSMRPSGRFRPYRSE